MNLKSSLFLLVILISVLSCKENAKKTTEREIVLNTHLIPYNSPLLDFNDPSVAIIDFRKKDAYRAGHLQGAINLYRDDIQDTTYPYKGIRISKELLAERLGKAGITEKHTLVVYDDKGSTDAARLWWLLRLYNFDDVHILDGGIDQWERMGGKLSLEETAEKQNAFQFVDKPDQLILVEKDELLKLIKSDASKAIILDTRSTDEYKGYQQKDGAKKAGRIPGSVNIDWAEAVDYGNTFTFKPIAELEKIYSRLGATKEDTIIVYCHSGVRSSHTTFVLTQLLNYKNVMNYDGSWVEWSYDDLLPYESDSLSLEKK